MENDEHEKEFLKRMAQMEEKLGHTETNEQYNIVQSHMKDFSERMSKFAPSENNVLPDSVDKDIEKMIQNGEVKANEVLKTIVDLVKEYQEIAEPTAEAIAEFVRYVDGLPEDKKTAGEARLLELQADFKNDPIFHNNNWIFLEGLRRGRPKKKHEENLSDNLREDNS